MRMFAEVSEVYLHREPVDFRQSINGLSAIVEGAMTKIYSGDLTERFCEDALELLGIVGTLGEDAPDAPMNGHLEQMLRRSIMLVVGGGAAEIQKTIIAQKGLGLPR